MPPIVAAVDEIQERPHLLGSSTSIFPVFILKQPLVRDPPQTFAGPDFALAVRNQPTGAPLCPARNDGPRDDFQRHFHFTWPTLPCSQRGVGCRGSSAVSRGGGACSGRGGRTPPRPAS